jgi:Phage P22-like portal protein
MSEKKDYSEVLQEARERLAHVLDTDKTNRDNYLMDTRFVYMAGEQWPEAVKRQREQWKELCLEFNQLKQFVAQVVNDQRQNRPGIRVHPANGEASEEVAEILQGLIRGIEYDSNAEACYDNAFQSAVVGGRGWWRIATDYVDNDAFEQKLVILPIFDSNTVLADNEYQQPDGSDRKFVFVTQSISKKDFAKQYPDASAEGLEIDTYWADGKDNLIIADYYRRVCKKRTMVLMSDGAKGFKDEMPTPPPNVTVVNEREVEDYSVEWYTIAGGNQVLKQHEWIGSYIPVVQTTGDDILLEGVRTYQGLVTHARDAQSMLNFGMTQQAIHLSLTPRAPWVAAEGQLEGYEQIWKDANTKNYSVLPYKPTTVEGILVPQPQRTAPSMPDAGWANWCQNMIQMIRSTIGMYENSLGMKGTEQSGRAIIAREKQGDNATFHYVDNLSRAIALTGRIMLEAIPTVYDTERIIHTIGQDDSRDSVTINQVTVDESLQAIKNNDITTGKYSVTVQAGPSYATKRQETADTLTQLAQAYPMMMEVAGDLVVKAQDIPDADIIAERLKLTLPPAIQQAEKAKQDKRKIDPQLLAEISQKDEQLAQAVEIMKEMESKIKSLESGEQAKAVEANSKAQIEATKAEADAQKEISKQETEAIKAQEQAALDKYNKMLDIAGKIVIEAMKQPEAEQQNTAAQTAVDNMADFDGEGTLQETVSALMQMAQNMQNVVPQLTEVSQKKQSVNDLMAAVMQTQQAILAPRQISLQTDEMGNVIGGVSQVAGVNNG